MKLEGREQTEHEQHQWDSKLADSYLQLRLVSVLSTVSHAHNPATCTHSLSQCQCTVLLASTSEGGNSPEWERFGRNSSLKGFPHTDWPPAEHTTTHSCPAYTTYITVLHYLTQ